MFSLIKKALNIFLRRGINAQNQRNLQNHSMSVLASNCNGAFILHDLQSRFNSPFVNLYLTPQDFIRYLQQFDYYRTHPLRFAEQASNYPIGYLDDLTVHFMHYHSAQEAEEKWQSRSARIDPDNLFIIMTDRDGCTYQDLLAFDQLPFKHKVVFTHKPYPEIASAFYIQGFEDQDCVGDLFEFSGWSGKKYYDQFDYVGWFNQGPH
ncbi:DUF1919 domain-containing protein [Caviibacterium pharyngocola]|uniref:Exopolysaccharide biosynthesis protein n=1 Tax=Caviibacterium pharyngocola TaxID=28159 RepID=A0A2M8RW66_9PAST|nr:DUF1919 domain-containing protein [Caviibacterium pharyngocola]PJG83138.1 exopolysaccharide biosynthesis protein [Caviibacterium pharyngocola]